VEGQSTGGELVRGKGVFGNKKGEKEERGFLGTQKDSGTW